ncbi:putative transposase [Thermus phage phiLo]|nr:putative transposase [Thermus phage phiLo]
MPTDWVASFGTTLVHRAKGEPDLITRFSSQLHLYWKPQPMLLLLRGAEGGGDGGEHAPSPLPQAHPRRDPGGFRHQSSHLRPGP